MCCESSDVVRFDLGPLLQGQTRIAKLKSAYNSLLLVLEVLDGKPTYGKSWAGNLVMWSHLTLGPSFKVKRWFTGFGVLSFRCIQICIGSLIRRSSFIYPFLTVRRKKKQKIFNLFLHPLCGF